jgi:hypothetical protein
MELDQDHEVRDNTTVLDALARLRAASSATGEDVLEALDEARHARSGDPQRSPETPPRRP